MVKVLRHKNYNMLLDNYIVYFLHWQEIYDTFVHSRHSTKGNW